MDQIYDERLLKKIDGEQSRRRICGAEVEALISFATGANLIENNMDRLSRMAQETGCSTQLKRCRTMAGNLLKQLGKGVSASQLITIANNCNDTTVTISSAPTAGYCNIEWKAMHTLCDAVIDACCWCCDCTRDKSKDCARRWKRCPGCARRSRRPEIRWIARSRERDWIGGMKMEKKKPCIELQDDNFGAVLNCAVRYSLGRKTYMPYLVTSFIMPLLPYLSDKTIWCFRRDVEECRDYGMDCDKETWLKFLDAVKAEETRRKGEPHER